MKKFGFFIAPFCIFIFAILMFGCSNYEKLLVNELSNDFSIVDNKYGKKLENAFKQYPGNDDICAIYFYYNALFYQQKDNQFDETINYKIYSQLFLRQINPTYNGAMSNEIHNLGIVLFGSKAEWEKQTKYFNTKYNKLSKENKKQIIRWIKKRLDYYENTYGYDINDKYIHKVFGEASTQFGFLYEEIDMLWWEYSLDPYPLNLN